MSKNNSRGECQRSYGHASEMNSTKLFLCQTQWENYYKYY